MRIFNQRTRGSREKPAKFRHNATKGLFRGIGSYGRGVYIYIYIYTGNQDRWNRYMMMLLIYFLNIHFEFTKSLVT
jgi:hypothetical protein